MMRSGFQDWRDCRETPGWLVSYVCKHIAGEPFALDAAASADNAKASKYWTKNDDALDMDWRSVDGWIWCNPPYRNKIPWVEKFAETRQCALLLPQLSYEYWWLRALDYSFLVVNFCVKRIHCPLPGWSPDGVVDYGPRSNLTLFVRGDTCQDAVPGTIQREGKIIWVDSTVRGY